MKETLQAAQDYVARGWSVIPLISHDKRPALPSWAPYTDHYASEAELKKWFGNGAESNIAIVAGTISHLLILDSDDVSDLAGLHLPPTPTVKTWRGWHYYYRLPEGKTIKNGAHLDGRKLDLRCESGYVVAPPSIHPSGSHYEWALPPETPLALPPDWLAELLEKRSEKKHADVGDIPDELPEKFSKLLEAPEHKQLKAAWEGQRKPKRDQSRSGFDLMMAALSIRAGLTDTEAASVLLRYPFGKARERGPDYIDRTIGTARAGLDDQKRARIEVPVTLCASSVERERVSWLWPSRIPRGKLSLIDGDPELGKTLIAIDIAARISRGDVMPDGSRGLGEPANVLIATKEDDLGDTMRPRLDAAGADLKRVFFLTGVTTSEGKNLDLSFPQSIDSLHRAIIDTGAVWALLDPLFAFVGVGTDAHRDAEIRRGMMSPLRAIAEETKTAITGIRHLNKQQLGRAVHRGGGSIAIVAAVRSAMLAALHPDDPELRVLACVKSNLTRRAASLVYRIVALQDDPEVPRVQWEGEHDATADELLDAQSEDKGALAEAKEFLRETLKGGPVKATKLFSEARAQKIADITLRRAKKSLQIVSDRMGSEGWYWSLP